MKDDEKPIWWAEIQELWAAAGQPSMRTIAAASGVSHTTVHSLISGERPGTWKTVSRVFHALGGDPEPYKEWIGGRVHPGPVLPRVSVRPDWATEQTELLTKILATLERIEAKL